MRIVCAIFAVLIAAATLAACGGSPMSVESRTGAEQPRELSPEERMHIKRQERRSRNI